MALTIKIHQKSLDLGVFCLYCLFMKASEIAEKFIKAEPMDLLHILRYFDGLKGLKAIQKVLAVINYLDHTNDIYAAKFVVWIRSSNVI